MTRTPPSNPVCPYCGSASVFLASSAPLYHGRDFGPVYACHPCGAWVGCHRGTKRPLGRLADATLRRAKIAAHDAFDRTWRAFHGRRQADDPNLTLRRARARAYKGLATLLAMPAEDCHIGLFDTRQCERVVDLCRSGALDDLLRSRPAPYTP